MDINSHPYHITSRCHNKEFFPIPLDEVWPIMMKHLKRCQLQQSLGIHAFVLMGNHFHLLCHTPKSNIEECMNYFLRSVSIDMKNHLWSDPYSLSLINSRRHYCQVYRYIFQNPIRAKIVTGVQDYPWTTLRKDLPFPLHSNIPMTFCGEEGELIWLNEKYQKEDLELIQLGLSKDQFELDSRKFKAFSR